MVAVPPAVESKDGIGFEVLLAKLDYLEYKFMELEYNIKEQNELLEQNHADLTKDNEGMTWMVTRLDEALTRNFTKMLNQSWQILQLQKSCSNHESLRKEIFNLKPIKGPSDSVRMLFDLHQSKLRGPYDSCSAVPTKTTGKYLLQPFTEDEPFVAYCEQTKFGGGWLVIQRRYDGSEDFLRNWTDYKYGFGEVDKEFWIGLELLYKLTSSKTYQLLVELEDFKENYKYAKFSEFEIGSEAEKYVLKKVGTYSGTAGDSLTYHKGMKFSTVDSDNDASSNNCAEKYTGAWWHNDCHYSNLNGKFMNADDSKSISWYNINNSYQGLKYARMLIREV
ncbi:microfibril-associated glycoprotein 4-like [Sabethes cyaneus]|uniref:microfibril-associated glycoprotein 4-like n=1 Tax=Sabethes cyaneus TaxID=53552 RepID=UPI00237D9327|nr:microfibril-associated glycoprotein 4-like [Sabethes cyaneus]